MVWPSLRVSLGRSHLCGLTSTSATTTASHWAGATQAWVFNPTSGPDIIPRLHDAKVNGMAQLGININGVEDIDGVLYAQSWWCRKE